MSDHFAGLCAMNYCCKTFTLPTMLLQRLNSFFFYINIFSLNIVNFVCKCKIGIIMDRIWHSLLSYVLYNSTIYIVYDKIYETGYLLQHTNL